MYVENFVFSSHRYRLLEQPSSRLHTYLGTDMFMYVRIYLLWCLDKVSSKSNLKGITIYVKLIIVARRIRIEFTLSVTKNKPQVYNCIQLTSPNNLDLRTIISVTDNCGQGKEIEWFTQALDLR